MKKTRHRLKKCISLGRRERFSVAALCTLCAVQALLGVGIALVCRELIDYAVAGNQSRFVSAGLMLCILSLVGILVKTGSTYIRGQAEAKMTASYRERFFNRCLRRASAGALSQHSGETMHRLTEDVAEIVRAQTVMLPEMITYAVQILSAAVILIIIDWRFSVLYLLLGTAIFLPTRLLVLRMKRLHRSSLEADAASRSALGEALTALEEIRAFGAEDAILNRQKAYQNHYLKSKKKQNAFSSLGNFGFGALMRAGYLFGFLWCGAGILQGRVSFGTLTAVQQLIGKIQSPISGISSMTARYAAFWASAERLLQIEEAPCEKKTVSEEEETALKQELRSISVEKLCFAYPIEAEAKGEAVLRGLSFSLRRGEKLAVYGESGIGKSTLIKLLLGLYKPDEGSAEACFTSRKMSLGIDTRGLFAYVPQSPTAFSGTIRENVTFFNCEADEKRLREVLGIACCDFVWELDGALETRIGENGAGLSQGQLQRLAIARALLTDSPVLLFDEATSALDEQTEKELLQNLGAIDGLTAVFITHRPAVSEICDQIITIE